MSKKILVAGASGLVGSNVVKAALARGYQVVGTMRNLEKASPLLMSLPGAKEKLSLVIADMKVDRSFDMLMEGIDAVFITCLVPVYQTVDGTPATELDEERGYSEIINPTVDGCLNIMRSAINAGIKDIVIGSSTSSTNPTLAVDVKNEVDHWSDEKQQCAAKKFTSATKTVMEKAAICLAKEHDVRLSIMLPTLMLGPMTLPSHGQKGFMSTIARLIDGQAPSRKTAINDSISLAHIDDVAALFLAAYENPKAKGRYFAVANSWHWNDIYSTLKNLAPEIQVPKPCEGTPNTPTGFNFKRRDTLNVAMRNMPEILSDTVAWVKTMNPYN